MRMLIGADGKELVPRHWYTAKEDITKEDGDWSRAESGFDLETVTPNENRMQYILRSPDGATKGTVALPLDSKDFTGFERAAVEGSEVAVTRGGYRDNPEKGIELSF